MFKNKWLLLSALMAASSLGLVACGDEGDQPCTSNNDCQEGEICLNEECEIDCTNDEFLCEGDEICIESGQPGLKICDPSPAASACTSDSDCGANETCDTVSGTCFTSKSCTTDQECGEGLICRDSTCVPSSTTECTDATECVGDEGYCSVDGSCVPFACGTTFNDCGRCGSGPGGGSRADQGPVIYLPEQVGSCSNDLSKCASDAPFVCTWKFSAYDIEGDLNFSSPTVKVITRSGSLVDPFGIRGNAGDGTIQFSACFPETSTGNVGTAVVVQDSAGHYSNSLCVAGNLR